MKQLALILLLFISILTLGQNLVPNPSFEDSYGCPLSNIYNNNFNNNWFNIYDSPDYFNSCDQAFQGIPNNFWGYQPAMYGNAYTGIGTGLWGSSVEYNGREYIQVQLNSVLQQDSLYCAYFFTNPANDINYSANDIGMLFTDTAIANGTQLPLYGLTPQISNSPSTLLNDTAVWYKISGTFIAQGTEEYITIGNFKTNSATSYTYIGGINNVSYNYIDSVVVYQLPLNGTCETSTNIPEVKMHFTKVFPNPTTGQLTISLEDGTATSVTIRNSLGQVLLSEKHASSNEVVLDISSYPSGLYFLQAEVNGNIITKKIIKQ